MPLQFQDNNINLYINHQSERESASHGYYCKSAEKKFNCLGGLLPNRIIFFGILVFDIMCALMSVCKGSFVRL